MFPANNHKGFTLIELLVVISIIGILSSFAIVSLSSARIKARDALRKGDMAQLRTALNLYYDDFIAYPVCDSGNWDPDWQTNGNPPMGSSNVSGTNCYNGILATSLSAGARPIMPDVPEDPMNLTNDPAFNSPYIYRYISNSDGTQYAVIYYLEENPTVPQIIRGW